MSPKTILVADDEPHIVGIIGDLLGGAGYRVVSTTRSEEVTALAKREPVDLVILDIHMPPRYLIGCDIAKALRAEPSLARVPVILLSCTWEGADWPAAGCEIVGPGMVRWCKDLPADQLFYLYKPFHSDELRALVDQLLQAPPQRDP